MPDTAWTMDILIGKVVDMLDLSAYSGAPNGRVRDVPDARVVRWYSTIGLVDRPVMQGRTALYGPRHLAQLVAIKRLQSQGRKLADIQAELAGVPDEVLMRIAGMPGRDFWKAPPAAHVTRDVRWPAADESDERPQLLLDQWQHGHVDHPLRELPDGWPPQPPGADRDQAQPDSGPREHPGDRPQKRRKERPEHEQGDPAEHRHDDRLEHGVNAQPGHRQNSRPQRRRDELLEPAGEQLMVGVPLGGGAVLLLPWAPGEDDVARIRGAARELMDVLDELGLTATQQMDSRGSAE